MPPTTGVVRGRMPLGNDGIPPNRLELGLRFGCGALLGLLVGGGSLLNVGVTSPGLLAAAAGVGALGAGLLARHFGDRFWSSLRQWL